MTVQTNGKVISLMMCRCCQPQFSFDLVLDGMSEKLGPAGYRTRWNALGGDMVLYLSGCGNNCATRVLDEPPLGLVVTGDEYVGSSCDEIVDDIVSKIVAFSGDPRFRK